MCSFSDIFGVHKLFTIFGVFASLCIRRTFLGAVARPRSHPAALCGVLGPSGGSEAARRGESFRDCERQRRPGASAGRWDGFLLTVWRLFCLLNVETSHGEVMIKGF